MIQIHLRGTSHARLSGFPSPLLARGEVPSDEGRPAAVHGREPFAGVHRGLFLQGVRPAADHTESGPCQVAKPSRPRNRRLDFLGVCEDKILACHTEYVLLQSETITPYKREPHARERARAAKSTTREPRYKSPPAHAFHDLLEKYAEYKQDQVPAICPECL